MFERVRVVVIVRKGGQRGHVTEHCQVLPVQLVQHMHGRLHAGVYGSRRLSKRYESSVVVVYHVQ